MKYFGLITLIATSLYGTLPYIDDAEKIGAFLPQSVERIQEIEKAYTKAFLQEGDLHERWGVLDTAHRVMEGMRLIAIEPAVREAAREAEQRLERTLVEHLLSHPEYYEQYEDLADRFKRYGLHLGKEKRREVQEIYAEILKLSAAFETNIQESNRVIEVDVEALEGLPESFITGLTPGKENTYLLGCDYPTYNRVMKECVVESTRKGLYEQFMNRGYPENEAILKELIAKRDTLAKIMGYDSYAAYDLSDQMIKTPERARAFLQGLYHKLAPKMEEEQKLLPSEIWNYMYATEKYRREHFDLSAQEIAAYFPFESTMEGMLKVYRTFFGIEIERVEAKDLWDQSLILFKIEKDGVLLGHTILDLFPRKDKYSHACNLGILPAYKDYPALTLLVANFSPLMTHRQVETLFHEFGHTLHSILGRQGKVLLCGTSTTTDFVELPSQILEEWLWNKEILQLVSCHHKTGELLPEDMIERMVAQKNLFSGFGIVRQIYLATLALDLFDSGAIKDPLEISRQLRLTYFPNLRHLDKDHFSCSFGHLTEYGAKYYGYLWSRALAQDVFDVIKSHGLLNPEIGERYVQEIIGKGGSGDPNDYLESFLGREPSFEPFIQSLGL